MTLPCRALAAARVMAGPAACGASGGEGLGVGQNHIPTRNLELEIPAETQCSTGVQVLTAAAAMCTRTSVVFA